MTTGYRGRGSCDSTYTCGGLCQARTHLDTPPREPRFSFLSFDSGACPGRNRRNMRGEETGTLDSHAPGFSWVGVAGASVESALTSSWRKRPPRSFVTTACAVNGPPHVNPRLASVHMTCIQTKSRAREGRRVQRPPSVGKAHCLPASGCPFVPLFPVTLCGAHCIFRGSHSRHPLRGLPGKAR